MRTAEEKAAYNEYLRVYMNNRYAARRAEAIDILGGECVECGTTDNLEFDHIDPTTKSFSIGRGSSFSDERWYAELEKCQILCHEHHVIKSIRNGDLVHKIRKGSDCNFSKLKEEDIPIIRELRAQSHSYQSIADRFGVGWGAIKGVCLGYTWKHIK